MFSQKNYQVLFIIFMAFGMSIIMSGVVVTVNTGIGESFFYRWFYSWLFAFPVALMAAFILAPIIKFLLSKIIINE